MKKSESVILTTKLLLSLIILITSGCGSSVALEPGSAAPDFSLPIVRGGSFQLGDFSGQVILLSFINTQAEAISPTSDPSRAQIVFLKSMQEQYDQKGLTVLIVDAARVATGKHPAQDKLINFTYDWQLDTIPVLDDSDSAVAKAYGVRSTPATFLIGADGIVEQRWDGFASSSQLALSIDALVGAPAHRQMDTAEMLVTSPAVPCPNEAPPQAKFAGVGLARPLSEELWVVDGGGLWGTGADFPVQWILIDTQNLTRQAPIHIQAIGQYADTHQIVPLSNQSMELLPTDVASSLLSGDTTPPRIYSLVTTVFLERAACLEIRAVVTGEGSSIPIYRGSIVISSR